MRYTRDIRMDAIKGILICLVVIGHSGEDILHDIIFTFHMPCFFMISGYFIKKNDVTIRESIKKYFVRLMIPHFSYLLLINILFYDFSVKRLWGFIYGGRNARGVVWYTTCLFVAICIFNILIRKCTDKIVLVVVFTCGILAVLESNMIDRFPELKSPGIPWSIDTSLIAILYIYLGYHGKNLFKNILDSKEKKDNLVVLAICAVLIVLFGYFKFRGIHYYFDMKPVYYKELVTAILIPLMVLVIMLRISHYAVSLKITVLFSVLGQLSLPIMYLHVYLNAFLRNVFGYGRGLYIIIGICIPAIFGIIVSNWKITSKVFGVEYKLINFSQFVHR